MSREHPAIQRTSIPSVHPIREGEQHETGLESRNVRDVPCLRPLTRRAPDAARVQRDGPRRQRPGRDLSGDRGTLVPIAMETAEKFPDGQIIDLIQGRLQKFHVVDLSSAGDYRQRDSTRVDQQASLAPIFFPDQSGWDRQLLAPEGL